VVNLASLHQQIEKGELQTLNVIIKADTQGSVEVLCDSFEKLGTAEVRVHIIHRGVGAINESDVLLAAASQALIFGFHVKREPRATSAAEREEVEIRLYDVIYEAVNDVTLAMEGLLKPEEIEHVRAEVEVKQIFRIPKRGTIAGSFVRSGRATSGSRIKVVRDKEVVHVGRLSSLKRFKDDVKEVESGLECGLSVENFDKIEVGDVVVFFETEQVLRKIS
jgi:translation initiation factor IF-2